jgi:hypothetical protein
MSEGVIIALISFASAVVGAAITGFATVVASGNKAKNENQGSSSSPVSCAVVGLVASIGAGGGLVLGALFGLSLVRADNPSTTSNNPVISQPTSAIPNPTLSFSINDFPCAVQFLEYRDTRSSSPLQSGFQASIGHNDNGSVKIFLSGQGETYRNYYNFTGECTSGEKVELLKREFQYIESNTRQYVPSFKLQEPVIVP